MWFKLAGATFTKNLGTMSSLSQSYSISYTLGTGLTKVSAPGSVANDNATTLTATFTLDTTNYELGTATVTMGGTTLTKDTDYTLTLSSTTLTLTIPKVSGSVSVTIGTNSIGGGSTGDSDTGSGDSGTTTPTVTYTWYSSIASTSNAMEMSQTSGNLTNGWTYNNDTILSAVRGVPINAVRLCTDSTSGTVTLGVVASGSSTTTTVLTGTFTKTSTSKEVVTIDLNQTVTLADNEYIVLEPSDIVGAFTDGNYTFYRAKTEPLGFFGRVPVSMDTTAAWSTNANANPGFDVGYKSTT